eukprot:COSAG02_NODE_1645_length_11523_cov_10.783876_15_plen_77_part_00
MVAVLQMMQPTWLDSHFRVRRPIPRHNVVQNVRQLISNSAASGRFITVLASSSPPTQAGKIVKAHPVRFLVAVFCA